MKKLLPKNNELNAQKGFNLIEVFIALAVGLFLFAGVLTIFVNMKTTSTHTSSFGEIQENGRFAISLISEDLLRQDFWGDYTGTMDLSSITPVPAAPKGECNGDGVNNGTFPTANGHFRTIWSSPVTAASIMSGCRTDAKIGSDILQLKRVKSNPLVDALGNPVATAPAGKYYLVSNINNGTIFNGGVVPSIKNGQVWEYQHHIYYVKEETQGSNSVPVLMMGSLSNELSFAPAIDGIERLHFMFGIDTDIDTTSPGYGIINAYISSNDMTLDLWNQNGSRILAVKIYVLARSIRPDTKYKNTNTYQLGDQTFVANDNYRRLLFSSTVTLHNSRIDIW
jgi:type IV pilus assembly protein PilW